ncbi:MAG TPA: ankyrin repeat domain-containing protein [Actinomycetota bacterium]|jgi:ankyrin repeat protein|nr:ankyrin repeat domain-containing protein [Actinomycetota bacterium]
MASTSGDVFALIDEGDVAAVRVLLAEQPWLAAERDDEGVSPLLRARYRMDKGMVEAVRTHVERLNVFEAAAFGDLDRLTELLAEDPELVDAMSGDGFTPLHLAAFFGQTDAVRLLLARGATVDRNGTGWMTGTPLHAAASGSHAGVVRMLLDAGADPNNRQRHGYTPLHSAAANGDLESIDLLLETGADPAATNDDGETALVLAEREDDLVIVERLRDATA